MIKDDILIRQPLALAVDDDESNRVMARALLEQQGFRVEEAEDGFKALAVFERLQPDLVLLDVVMPKIDGFEVCAAIRNFPGGYGQHTAILVMTGLNDMESINRAYEVGATDFITKPINWMVLGNRLRYMWRAICDKEELRESEKNYREIFNSTSEAIMIDNAETGKIIDVNETTLRMYGYCSKEELLAGNIGELSANVRPFTELEAQELIKKCINEGPQVFDWLAKKKTGETFWTEVSLRKSEIGGKGKILAVVRNITKRKQAEEALRTSEEKYRTVADFTCDWEAWGAPDGTYRYVSPSCERITGHTVSEFLADPNLMVQITHPDDRPKVIEHIHSATYKAQEQDLEFDFRILTPSGEIRWISHRCTAVYGEGGQWLGRRESNRDITDHKQAEVEKTKLEAQNRQLQKAESLGIMVGAIAHHFNNQLQAVMGNLEIAMDDLPLGVNPIESLVSAMQAARKAAEVSGLMLTYLGQTPGKHEPIDLSEVCRRSLTLFQAAAPKGMILNADLPSSGPVIRGNAGQIQQALANLVTNAWEAVGENQGGIVLTVKTVSHADIPASNRFPIDWKPQESDYVCLEVADEGYGISDRDFEKLFDPFFTTKFTGRGLGLPVVLGIVGTHGGGVTVESEPGRGSVFGFFCRCRLKKSTFSRRKRSQPRS